MEFTLNSYTELISLILLTITFLSTLSLNYHKIKEKLGIALLEDTPISKIEEKEDNIGEMEQKIQKNTETIENINLNMKRLEILQLIDRESEIAILLEQYDKYREQEGNSYIEHEVKQYIQKKGGYYDKK